MLEPDLENDMRVGTFRLPRRLVLRDRCPHLNFMAFFLQHSFLALLAITSKTCILLLP
jgi:hypothetical protein